MTNPTLDFSEHLTSHNQIWRFFFGFLSVLVIYAAAILAYFFGLSSLSFNIALVLRGSTPENLALLLLSFFPVWISLAIVNKVLHYRPVRALYVPSYATNWHHFKTAAIFFIAVIAAGEILLQI